VLFRDAGIDRERRMDAPGLVGESGSCAEDGTPEEEAATEVEATRCALAMLALLVVRAEALAEAAAALVFSARSPAVAGARTLLTRAYSSLWASPAEAGACRSSRSWPERTERSTTSPLVAEAADQRSTASTTASSAVLNGALQGSSFSGVINNRPLQLSPPASISSAPTAHPELRAWSCGSWRGPSPTCCKACSSDIGPAAH